MVLAIGELSYRKNHAIIAKALAKIGDKNNYVYAICGREMTDGGIADEIRKISEDNGINTIFLGFRSDIPEIIKCADIGVMPSIREGLGLAGIEMLSGGIPVVGSDVQGIKEYVIDGKTGFLCNPYDADAFANGIKKLSDKRLRASMQQHCLEIVKKFDKQVSIKQRQDIYNRILI